jgi:small-conductance mechanosensitive channel
MANIHGNLLIELAIHSEAAGIFWQVAALCVVMPGAWWLDKFILQKLTSATQNFATHGVKRLIFPVAAWLGAMLAYSILDIVNAPTTLLKLAVPLFLSLAFIRLFVYLLHKAFPQSSAIKSWELSIALIAWLVLLLYVTGLLEVLLDQMSAFGFNLGNQRISLLTIMQGILSLVTTLLISLWLGRFIETRIMAFTEMDTSSRVLLSKTIRGILLAVSVLIALSLVGIDVTVLSLFGGALGVGLGFGLQRIASNYISGFIILMDKSIRLNDIITLDNCYGTVSRLTGRYMVLRSQDGLESLIPNELAITKTLINHSFTDRKVCITVSLQITYSSSLDKAMAIMINAARAHDSIISDPAPVVKLVQFTDSGLLLELSAWIDNPALSQSVLCSDLNLVIWRDFKRAGFEIPCRCAKSVSSDPVN